MQCNHIYGDDQPAKRGQQCRRSVKFGFNHCNFHGGNTAPAKALADKAFALARMPAIEALFNIVEQFNSITCATCGYPNGDTDSQRAVIRAAQVILDRTGMGAHSTLEVKQTDGTQIDLRHLLPEERAEMAALVTQFKQLKARIKKRFDPNGDPQSGTPFPPVVPVPEPGQVQ